jgi:hypothetical protein
MDGWKREFTFKAISDMTGKQRLLTVWGRYERHYSLGSESFRMQGRILTTECKDVLPVQGEKGVFQVGASSEILRTDDPRVLSLIRPERAISERLHHHSGLGLG